jgi:3-deoxy-D-manno-octulosonate 8-phosphate phosphatase (KDO 8-P phosphatase)
MFHALSNQTLKKAKKIRAIIFDVDGVLTDGGIIYTSSGEELKRFNVKDGQIISHLHEMNFVTGIITGRTSPIVEKRARELKIDFFSQGAKNKLTSYINFKEKFNLKDEEIAYIGDDIIDLPILLNCGFSGSPKDARDYIKTQVDFITPSKGGEGALRDFIDLILFSQNKLDNIIEYYSNL